MRCPTLAKVRFRTERAAQYALIGAVIRRNGGARQRQEQRHYLCPCGRHWRLTSETDHQARNPQEAV